MPRYFIKLAFNGTAYHGWQLQPNAITVQQILGEALSMILRHETGLTGCGRTDTGVHASEYFAHFETDPALTAFACRNLTAKLNAFLPKDISIEKIFPVPDDAHARFSALSRTYEYRISRKKNPFLEEFSFQYTLPLDIGRMNACAKIITEFRDFSCFSKSHTQTKTNDCMISGAEWIQQGDQLIFRITADRFLRNMVRAIVGTLIDAGRGKTDEDGIREIILSGNRCEAGKSMPACGLFLTAVRYPEDILIYMRD